MPEQSVFVARERELAVLNGALYRALIGQGSVVFVAGEKGTGKTRLVHEFIAEALARPQTIIPAAGASNPATRESEPFLPFRSVMEMLAGEAEGGRPTGGNPLGARPLFPEERVRENELHREHLRKFGKALKRILTTFGPELASAWVPGLGVGKTLLDFFTGERAAVAPQSWRERVYAQYPATITHLAEEFPLILLLNDFHWADDSSLGMLYHLAEAAARHRLLLLVTFRSHEPDAHRLITIQRELETRRQAASLSLDLRDTVPEEVAKMRAFVNQFVDHNYAPNALDNTFRDRLVAQTEGHAFIVEETLLQFKGDGTLRRDGQGRWVLTREPEWNRLPQGVEGMVKLRLEGAVRRGFSPPVRGSSGRRVG